MHSAYPPAKSGSFEALSTNIKQKTRNIWYCVSVVFHRTGVSLPSCSFMQGLSSCQICEYCVLCRLPQHPFFLSIALSLYLGLSPCQICENCVFFVVFHRTGFPSLYLFLYLGLSSCQICEYCGSFTRRLRSRENKKLKSVSPSSFQTKWCNQRRFPPDFSS